MSAVQHYQHAFSYASMWLLSESLSVKLYLNFVAVKQKCHRNIFTIVNKNGPHGEKLVQVPLSCNKD